jgi:ElaB/YqjD/DUF883 family membrane-anchored ribosome-binding protein
MNERAEGTIADAGEAVQRHVNRADEAADQVTGFIREHPIAAVLLAVAAGYILGKAV